jgi:phytoene dehydrogenase-like protein
MTWPHYAPKGKNAIWLWQPLSADDKDPKKNLEVTVDHCRNAFPDFDKYCRIVVNQSFYNDWPVMRSTPGTTIDQKTPIENLYNVGDGVSPFGYVMGEGAAESGKVVVEDIRKRMAPA